MEPIEYENASEEVRALYDEIKAARGVPDVNNIWKYLAHHPATARDVWEGLKKVMGPGELAPEVKELIYVAVSIANRCEYCVNTHSAAALKKGATPGMLNEMLAIVGMASKTNALAVGYQVPLDE